MKSNFLTPGLKIFYSVTCSSTGAEDMFSSSVLPTVALYPRRRETCIWKGLECHNHAAGI